MTDPGNMNRANEGRGPVPVLRWILAALGALTLSSCYVTTQGTRYLSLLSRAERVERILSDPDASPEIKDLVVRAERIRSFAIQEFGLADTRNYRSVVRLDSDALATVVSACDAVSFRRHLWKYPVVGDLPYKGFFKPAEAEREAARLRGEGLDVLVRTVDAFSTLGWLPDPLFSTFSRYDDGQLAELILHELAHATVFVKGAEQFNEEFATFVGRQGALRYLARVHGDPSSELAAFQDARTDADAFAAFLRETADRLETLYGSGRPREEILSGKAEILAARARDYRETASVRFRSEDYRVFPMDRINNAYLDLYRLYEGEPEVYGEYLDSVCGGDLSLFVRKVKDLAGNRGDPKDAIRKAIRGLP